MPNSQALSNAPRQLIDASHFSSRSCRERFYNEEVDILLT